MLNLGKGKGKEFVFWTPAVFQVLIFTYVSFYVMSQMLIFTLLWVKASGFQFCSVGLNNLSKVAQLKSTGAGIQTQSFWAHGLCSSFGTTFSQRLQGMKCLCIGPSSLGLYREFFRGQRWWFCSWTFTSSSTESLSHVWRPSAVLGRIET